jgi:hypothetical protein
LRYTKTDPDIYINNNNKLIENPQVLYFIEEIYNSILKNSNFHAIHAELKSLTYDFSKSFQMYNQPEISPYAL